TLWGQPVLHGKGNNYSTANITLYIDEQAGGKKARAVEGTIDLIKVINGRQFTNPVAITGTAVMGDNNTLQINYTAHGAVLDGAEGTIDWTFDFPRPREDDISGLINDYVEGLRDYETEIRKRHHWRTVFLP